MTTDTRRPTGPLRTSTALTGAALLLGSLTLGACSSTDATAAAQSRPAQAQPALVDGDTVDLVAAAVDTSAAVDVNGTTPATADRKGLRARMLRALHATWVTGGGKAGPVTHQAVRGEVTAVSATAITVRATDGFTLTYAVGADTKVRERPQGKGKGKGKATSSTVSAVRVGARALVTGVGATKPTARVVVFRDAPAASGGAPTPSATS